MPLMHGKSDKAFSHNVAAEMHAGKPQKQSLAIAYSVKRRAKKMAMGGYAEGGEAEEMASGYEAMPCPECGVTGCTEHGDSMADGGVVDRIMKNRMSEGGRVANETEPRADAEPAEFDDLVLDDDLKGHYPGSQEHGDARETHDREDVVARIMKSRAKKDRLPRPA